MKINPESWLLSKDKSVLLNIDDRRAIRKKGDYFELCNTASDPEGYCRIIGKDVVVPIGLEEKYFVDDLIYAKLTRVFQEGFDYSDYNLY